MNFPNLNAKFQSKIIGHYTKFVIYESVNLCHLDAGVNGDYRFQLHCHFMIVNTNVAKLPLNSV